MFDDDDDDVIQEIQKEIKQLKDEQESDQMSCNRPEGKNI